MLKMTLAAIALTLVHGIANAQHGQPYAGLQERSIKALSAEQIGDLRAGRGMGLALAAELNGYPGPVHVIELADALELKGDQRARINKLLAAMKAEAIPLGERLIVQEAAWTGNSRMARSAKRVLSVRRRRSGQPRHRSGLRISGTTC